MSYLDYKGGQRLELLALNNDVPFYGVIQCAMRMADTDNLEALKVSFPSVWNDLQQRYNAPNGLLDGEEIHV